MPLRSRAHGGFLPTREPFHQSAGRKRHAGVRRHAPAGGRHAGVDAPPREAPRRILDDAPRR
eukprot:5347300-Prymnesium_polylepis.1